MNSRDPVSKAFALLSYFVESGDSAWSVRRLATEFDLPASTVHRTLNSLVDVGVLRRSEKSQLYHLADGLHRLARRAIDVFPLPEVSRPHLETLSQETDETALLGVQEAGAARMMFCAQVEGSHALRYVVPLYTWVPLHLGASGLALFAFLDPDERESHLEALEAQPGVDIKLLRERLEKTREQGYAISHGQRIPGAVGIAAPVFGSSRTAVADVLLTIPEGRLSDVDQAHFIELVRSCAERVTAVAGG